MDPSEILIEGLRENPYRAELTEIARAAKRDPQAVPKLFRKLQVRIAEDVRDELAVLDSRIARLKVRFGLPGAGSDIAKLVDDVTGIVEESFDVCAGRQLAAWAWLPDAEPMIELLARLAAQQGERWEPLSIIFGEGVIEAVIQARVAHWKMKAKELARCARDRKTAASSAAYVPMEPNAREAQHSKRESHEETKLLEERAASLKREMDARKLSPYGVEKNGGPDRKTVSKVLHCELVRVGTFEDIMAIVMAQPKKPRES